MLKIIQPILKRFGITNGVKADEDTLSFDMNGFTYEFVLIGEKINVTRVGKKEMKSYIMVSEIPRINHVLAPFMKTFELAENFTPGIDKFSADDIMLRLHLIMKGDIYEQHETIFFIGAGAQTRKNLFLAV
jgi:hypothetical protein